MDVWKEPSKVGGSIDIHVSARDVEEVKKALAKFTYKIIIDDLEQLVAAEAISNAPNAFSSSYDYNRYNQYPQVGVYTNSSAAIFSAQRKDPNPADK